MICDAHTGRVVKIGHSRRLGRREHCTVVGVRRHLSTDRIVVCARGRRWEMSPRRLGLVVR